MTPSRSLLWPECPVCQCPGGVLILNLVACPNPDCRHYSPRDLHIGDDRINGTPTWVIREWIEIHHGRQHDG